MHAPSHGLPVCGRIEFDIDIIRAKWYNAWMGFTQEGISRESSVVPLHWRGESRASFLHPDLNDDTTSPPQEIAPSKSTRRQAPKPLYLEKRDILHQRSSSRNSIRNVLQDPPDQHENLLPSVAAPAAQPFIPNTLSPMVQELEEPQSSKNAELDTMVKKWRESSIIASAAPSIIVAANPPSSDPDAEIKLNLEDFTWSVSSVGPPSLSPASPGWPERIPSVHLADRMQTSRCNTPTSCTSWGPSAGDGELFDYDRQSYRLPSPDIGHRALDFAPLTPSTCTSWGANDLPSPVFSHPRARALSIDVGVRAAGSVPVTPLTCTSWGAPDVASPVLSLRSYTGLSVDLGARRRGSVPVTPSTATSWGPSDTPISQRHDLENAVDNDSSCWPHVWPYTRTSSSVSVPWKHVWPYVRHSTLGDTTISSQYTHSIEVNLDQYPALRNLYPPQVEDDNQILWNNTSSYPLVKIYESVYPYNLAEIYPEIPSGASAAAGPSSSPILSNEETATTVCYPSLVIYPAVYPHNLELIYPIMTSAFDVQHLSLETVDSWNYPHFDIYPSIYSENNNEMTSWPDVGLPSAITISNTTYPEFDLYPSVYPFNLDYIYPEVTMNLQQSASSDEHTVFLYTEYPSFTIYPPVYPFNLVDIYPSISSKDEVVIEEVELKPALTTTHYPVFDLYPSVYPFNLLDLYPAKIALNPSTIENTIASPSAFNLNTSLHELRYPFFELYPAVYPYSMDNIYPTVLADSDSVKEISISNLGTSSLGPHYPFFDIYPSLSSTSSEYPQITLYGTVYGSSVEKSQDGNSADKPIVSVYSPPYPFVDIYPQSHSHKTEGIEGSSLSLAPSYPIFDLYPPVYPFNLEKIYGPISVLDDTTSRLGSEQRTAEDTTDYGVYPHLIIYPAGYPWSLSQIYEPIVQELLINEAKDDLESAPIVVEYSQGYPTFALYPPSQGYPDFVLYPPVWQGGASYIEEENIVIPANHANYPIFNLYPSQYPYISVYPDVVPIMEYPVPEVSQKTFENIDYSYPFFCLYPSVYPYFDLYPELGPSMQDPTAGLPKPNQLTTRKVLEKDGNKLQQTPEPSSPPPIPSKPKSLRGTSSRSSSLEIAKPIKRRRTHHELYMAVLDDVQRALKHEAISETKAYDSEGTQDPRANQRPSLLRKPSVVAPRYVPAANRIVSTHPIGLPSSPFPKDAQAASTFTGHVSKSIHNRVQSMHFQSLSKPKEETEKSSLGRSKSLSDRAASIVQARAKLYSTQDSKQPPPLPRKPSIKLGVSNPTYVQSTTL